MKNRIEELFKEKYTPGYFKLIEPEHPLALYIGMDANGHYAIEFRGNFSIEKVKTPNAIEILYSKPKGTEFKNSIMFSLLENNMLDTFCVLCEDLVESTKDACNHESGLKKLLERFRGWVKLFLLKKHKLEEKNIMGLIGELMFLKNELIPKYGKAMALSSWTGSEKTKKDFSIANTWFEVKAPRFGKGMVHISSYEQLDSENSGHLVVYPLEKMSPEYNGVTLNSLVHSILTLLDSSDLKDLFLLKLAQGDYLFDREYDAYVYDVKPKMSYAVSQDFPCLRRVPETDAVHQVEYDLLLSKIEKFKEV